jgi:hypothetical protein
MHRILMLIGLFVGNSCLAQHLSDLKINSAPQEHVITRQQKHNYEISLKKHIFYRISVKQTGIDVVVMLKDRRGHVLAEKDSPTGRTGTEKLTFSPDSSDRYTIVIEALDEAENANSGNYAINVATISQNPITFSLPQLQKDFDILKNAYIETRVGLWYNSYTQFDSLCRMQRQLLRDKMTALDFYKIAAPVTAFTKEGHSSLTVSEETSDYFKQYGSYFPFFIKIIDKKIYVLNDWKKLQTKGLRIVKINGLDADSILHSFERIEPADGDNSTSKYRWIESAFAKYYLRFFGYPSSYQIEFIHPATNVKVNHIIPSLKYKDYLNFRNDFLEQNPNYTFSKPAALMIDSLSSYALLTINDFGAGNYKGKKGFKKFLDETFTTVNKRKVNNLIIDLRKNEGGNQGMEDILLSYLTVRNYKKYKYVEIPSFHYSFIDYTNYSGQSALLEKELSEEFALGTDGRYLQKEGEYEGLGPDPIHFKGKVYILIGGLTFSGGSEFAALAKNHTSAIFIGEETGGGYYGNTSGRFLNFTLPNTQTTGRIPLCKFVVETTINTVPMGHGIIPDHVVQPSIGDYLNNKDVELDYVKKIMSKN